MPPRRINKETGEPELTWREKRFVDAMLHEAKGNPTEAARIAYRCSDDKDAADIGRQVSQRIEIQEEIDKQKEFLPENQTPEKIRELIAREAISGPKNQRPAMIRLLAEVGKLTDAPGAVHVNDRSLREVPVSELTDELMRRMTMNGAGFKVKDEQDKAPVSTTEKTG